MSTDTVLPERKRKHKNKEHEPSKKRKNAATTTTTSDDVAAAIPSTPKQNNTEKTRQIVSITDATKQDASSPFRLINATMYVPLSPISISPTHASASLIAEHLAPLLLTYYPPFQGIVLAYSNGSISESPPVPGQVHSSSSQPDFDNPKPLTLALTANEYGVLYLYLTATFLVFSPQKGQVLEGWVNVQSEGFVGAIAHNLFSVGIERKRVPKSWKWIPPGADDDDVENAASDKKKGYVSATSGDEDGAAGSNKLAFDAEKEHFTPLPKKVSRQPINLPDSDTNMFGEEFGEYDEEEDDEASNATGYFQSVSGHCVRGTIRFRVRDVDVIPGADPDRGFLSIEGTMLTPEEEAKLEEEERNGPLPASRQRDPYAMTGAAAQPVSHAQTSQVEVAEVQLPETTTTPATAKSGFKDEKKKEKKEKKKSKDKSKSKTLEVIEL